MSSKFQIFKKKFFNNYIMPKEIKAKIVERNIRLLTKVSLGIFIVSILTLLPLLFSPDKKGSETTDYIFHYTSMGLSKKYKL